jgi:hypothetical protein
VLVLEVKRGELRKLSTTGRWEGPERDHPVTQLLAEWHAIIDALRQTAGNRNVPFVAKALCLPDVDIDPNIPSYKEIDRDPIVDRGDLSAFEMTWHRLFGKRRLTISNKQRTTFLDSFAKDISPQGYQTFHFRER